MFKRERRNVTAMNAVPIAILLLLVACTPHPTSPASSSMNTCVSASDCAVVKDCCGCNTLVHKQFVSTWNTQLTSCPKDTLCEPCGDFRIVTCDHNVCVPHG